MTKIIRAQAKFRGAIVRRGILLRHEAKYRPLRRRIIRQERGEQEFLWLQLSECLDKEELGESRMQGVNLSRGRRSTAGAKLDSCQLPKELAAHVKKNVLYDWLELVYTG